MKEDILNWLPKLQSHRGYWVEGSQQNSLVSIKKANQLGYSIVEFDVRLTKDRTVILFHDPVINGKMIHQLVFSEFCAEAKKLSLTVTTLEDVFIWLTGLMKENSQKSFKLNIEIKSKEIFNSQLEKQVYVLIKKYALEKFVLVSSFNPISLFRFYRYDKRIYRALLLTKSPESNVILNNMWLNFMCRPHVLHLRAEDFSSGFKNKYKLQIPIVLWTVNDKSLFLKYKDEVFGIISDRVTPEAAQDF